jgi:hypothetical protein
MVGEEIMFCRKCGTETPDDSQFCRKCGLGLAVSSTSTGAGAAVAPARITEVPKEAPKKAAVRTPFIIAGVVMLALVAYGIYATSNSSRGTASPIERLVKQQHVETAKNPDLRINALSFYSFKFDVPQGATSVQLHGNFTASGGLTNDIEAFVLSSDDFVNWQNRHAARSLYNSGKVTVGTLNVNLPADAGTYYLVFNNRFSLLTQRSVLVDATLTYYQ